MLLSRCGSFVVLVFVYFAVPSAESAACPYKFDEASRLIPATCYPNYTGPDPANCCWFVSAAYLYAGIMHSNATGEAFLPASAASACSTAFTKNVLARHLVAPSLVLSGDRCNINASSFAAGSRPCVWPSVSDIAAAVSFAGPSRACTQKDVGASQGYCTSCQNEVINVTLALLDATRSKEFVPCGMAATIGIWAHSPDPSRFRSYVLCLVQVLDNVGNLGTADLIPSPPPPPSSSSSQPSKPSRNPLSAAKIAALVACSVFFVAAVLSLLLLLLICRRRRLKNAIKDGLFSTATFESKPLPVDGLYIFTPKELKSATSGFDRKLLVGEGASGKVYLGTLPSGQYVAIKRIYRRLKVEEFYREVEILASLRHHRLTTLVGYCLHPRELALVYEYMAGGNLSTALREGKLTWRQRVKIAADVAEGLAYLHAARVVHRDVKPGNVLLGESGDCAKLSDFGVSRVVPSGHTHLSTDLKGTMGYVDPDCFPEGHVSEASDVFSFGVVLLELVTGRRAVEPTESGGAESIVHRFTEEEEAEDRALEVVDPRVRSEADPSAVAIVFTLARACVRPCKQDRPNAKAVLEELMRVLGDKEEEEEEKKEEEEEEETSIELSSAPTTSQTSTPPPPQRVQPWSL